MSNLAFYASPIDFQKNDKLNNKIEEMKKTKLNSSFLKKLSSPNENEVQNIHNTLIEENENVLAVFYNEMSETKMKQNLYLEAQNKDYLISNNLNMNQVSKQNSEPNYNNQEILQKLNYIINSFEEQKEIKTNQKNEEVVLYCFLGIFVIYVLDSFVYIGKYSR